MSSRPAPAAPSSLPRSYAKAMQDYVSLFTKDNVVQVDVLAWDAAAGVYSAGPDPRRMRAYYVFPDRNKSGWIGVRKSEGGAGDRRGVE